MDEAQRILSEYDRREKEIPHDFYSLSRPGNRFIYDQRFKAVEQALKGLAFFPLSGKEILEMGCGKGGWLLDFQRWGAEESRLHGIDLMPARIEEAKKRFPAADLRVGEASKLPWPDAHFDLVLQSTVFTSILDPGLKAALAAEMLRGLKPGGIILWYDFRYNNPWNPNVRGIEIEEIKVLFPECEIQAQKITLAPPLARALAGFSWGLCLMLQKIGPLNTHYLALIRKDVRADLSMKNGEENA